MARMRASAKAALTAATFAGIVVLILLFLIANLLWTEYQWYQSMGHTSVLFIRLISQGLLWIIATVVSSGAIFGCATIAGRQRDRQRGFTAATAGVSLLLGALISWNLSSNWMTFRLAVEQSPFGITDPLFGKDVGFFVFTLPALELAAVWASGVIVIALLVVLAVAIFPEAGDTRPVLAGHWWQLKPLFSVLFGLLVLTATFSAWLSIWQLTFSRHSQFNGASYVDVHAGIPALWVQIAFGLAIAAVAILGARSKGWKLLAGLIAGWAVASILFGSVWPWALQNYVVNPNEASLEKPYIENNIAMTRLAFGLDAITGVAFPAEETLTASAAAAGRQALSQARVWTPKSVSQAFTQLQTIRPYYSLSTIDTDRYSVNGTLSQVLVSARQVDTTGLPGKAQTWVNQHLVYTHGYGLAISSASETNALGFPTFLVGDVPPAVASQVATDSPDLEISEPRIYFTADTADYAFVNTGIDEFDYPSGEDNVTCRDVTGAGVRLGSLFNRVCWAIRLGSNQVLFSNYVTPESRVLVYRSVRDRARKLAPWLVLDDTPYAAIVDGRIVWILDGYTSSDHFPYSQPLGDGTNYLRDSVKIVVDAASGQTTLYASGDDPVRDAWSSIYPGVIQPEDSAPASLAAHFRVPKKMFTAQAKIYRTYHMTDPSVFYNREDQWEFSGESSNNKTVSPSYVVLSLPGSSTPGLYLVQPFAPQGSDNLVGWLAASCEPDEFGEQTVYLLPKDRVVLGPQQMVARIQQDPDIAPQLALWGQRGNKVIFGDMLVLPVETSIAYIQPLFLQAKDTAITENVAVVVAEGDRVEMGSTLSEALDLTFGTAGEN